MLGAGAGDMSGMAANVCGCVCPIALRAKGEPCPPGLDKSACGASTAPCGNFGNRNDKYLIACWTGSTAACPPPCIGSGVPFGTKERPKLSISILHDQGTLGRQ